MTQGPLHSDANTDQLGIGALTLPEIEGGMGRRTLMVVDALTRARSIDARERASGLEDLVAMARDALFFPEIRELLEASLSHHPRKPELAEVVQLIDSVYS